MVDAVSSLSSTQSSFTLEACVLERALLCDILDVGAGFDSVGGGVTEEQDTKAAVAVKVSP